MAGSHRAPLDLFDVGGRRLVSLSPADFGGEVRWSWNGLDARGAPVASGVVLARVRDGSGATRRFTWLR